MQPAMQPGMLASNADRDRAVDVLKAAYGEGRLTKQEFDYRCSQVMRARRYGELAPIVADLPNGPFGAVPVPYAQPQYYPEPRQTTNGLAVASLVCALLGISLPAAIMGHAARSQIQRTGQGGDGLATAGIIIGWLGVAFYTLMIVIAVAAASRGVAFNPGTGPG